MALVVAGITVTAPSTQEATPKEISEQMQTQFDWHPSITEHLVANGLASVEDFVYAFPDENKAAALISDVRECPEDRRLVMGARIKRAWIGVREALTQATSAKQKDTTAADLDAVLSQDELNSLEDLFWARTRIVFPPAVEPADALKSRLHREITRRILTIRDIWGGKDLDHQMRASKRKKDITEKLVLISGPEEEPINYDKRWRSISRIFGHWPSPSPRLAHNPPLQHRRDRSAEATTPRASCKCRSMS